MRDTKKIILIGLYISIALMFNIFENYLPTKFILPGAKLGLANIITVLSLYTLNKSDTFLIIVIRVILGSIFGGGLSSFLYSFSGAVLSFFAMNTVMILFKNRISVIGVSVTGAYFHSVGQILMSVIILSNIRMFIYLPSLLFASIITGIFIGYVVSFLLNRKSVINF